MATPDTIALDLVSLARVGGTKSTGTGTEVAWPSSPVMDWGLTVEDAPGSGVMHYGNDTWPVLCAWNLPSGSNAIGAAALAEFINGRFVIVSTIFGFRNDVTPTSPVQLVIFTADYSSGGIHQFMSRKMALLRSPNGTFQLKFSAWLSDLFETTDRAEPGHYVIYDGTPDASLQGIIDPVSYRNYSWGIGHVTKYKKSDFLIQLTDGGSFTGKYDIGICDLYDHNMPYNSMRHNEYYMTGKQICWMETVDCGEVGKTITVTPTTETLPFCGICVRVHTPGNDAFVLAQKTQPGLPVVMAGSPGTGGNAGRNVSPMATSSFIFPNINTFLENRQALDNSAQLMAHHFGGQGRALRAYQSPEYAGVNWPEVTSADCDIREDPLPLCTIVGVNLAGGQPDGITAVGSYIKYFYRFEFEGGQLSYKYEIANYSLDQLKAILGDPVNVPYTVHIQLDTPVERFIRKIHIYRHNPAELDPIHLVYSLDIMPWTGVSSVDFTDTGGFVAAAGEPTAPTQMSLGCGLTYGRGLIFGKHTTQRSSNIHNYALPLSHLTSINTWDDSGILTEAVTTVSWLTSRREDIKMCNYLHTDLPGGAPWYWFDGWRDSGDNWTDHVTITVGASTTGAMDDTFSYTYAIAPYYMVHPDGRPWHGQAQLIPGAFGPAFGALTIKLVTDKLYFDALMGVAIYRNSRANPDLFRMTVALPYDPKTIPYFKYEDTKADEDCDRYAWFMRAEVQGASSAVARYFRATDTSLSGPSGTRATSKWDVWETKFGIIAKHDGVGVWGRIFNGAVPVWGDFNNTPSKWLYFANPYRISTHMTYTVYAQDPTNLGYDPEMYAVSGLIDFHDLSYASSGMEMNVNMHATDVVNTPAVIDKTKPWSAAVGGLPVNSMNWGAAMSYLKGFEDTWKTSQFGKAGRAFPLLLPFERDTAVPDTHSELTVAYAGVKAEPPQATDGWSNYNSWFMNVTIGNLIYTWNIPFTFNPVWVLASAPDNQVANSTVEGWLATPRKFVLYTTNSSTYSAYRMIDGFPYHFRNKITLSANPAPYHRYNIDTHVNDVITQAEFEAAVGVAAVIAYTTAAPTPQTGDWNFFLSVDEFNVPTKQIEGSVSGGAPTPIYAFWDSAEKRGYLQVQWNSWWDIETGATLYPTSGYLPAVLPAETWFDLAANSPISISLYGQEQYDDGFYVAYNTFFDGTVSVSATASPVEVTPFEPAGPTEPLFKEWTVGTP